MNLRLNLALTSFRQVDITVRDDIRPAELQMLARYMACQTHGYHDLVVVQSIEELPAWEPEESEEGE